MEKNDGATHRLPENVLSSGRRGREKYINFNMKGGTVRLCRYIEIYREICSVLYVEE